MIMKSYRSIVFALACILAAACGEKIEQPPIALSDVTEVSLELSSKMMVANGEDKLYFTVYGNGHDMTKWAKVYLKGGYENIGASFSTDKAGVYEFWAEVGTTQTPKGEYARVEAVEYRIPDAPSDPQPSNTSFVKRAFILQYTGTGCGYCPWFIAALEKLGDDAEYRDRFVLAAAHSYPSGTDPMYIGEEYLSVNDYPYIKIDNKEGLYRVANVQQNIQALQEKIDNSLASAARSGIAVNSELIGNYLTAKVQLKAAAAQEYCVSCWLVEDGISAVQENYDGVEIEDIHNAAIRACTSRFWGKSLGRISAGQNAETAFTYSLAPEWKKENCRLVVFVTVPSDGYKVDNCISAPLGEAIQFSYLQ